MNMRHLHILNSTFVSCSNHSAHSCVHDSPWRQDYAVCVVSMSACAILDSMSDHPYHQIANSVKSHEIPKLSTPLIF